MTSLTDQMLSEALSQYIDNAEHPEDQSDCQREKIAAAQSLLDVVDARLAAGA